MRNLLLSVAVLLSNITFAQSTNVTITLKGDGWALNTRFGGRSFVLNATKPGMYMVTQEIDDEIIQLSSVSVE